MSKRGVPADVAASAWCVLVLAACGGQAKPAQSAGTCPEGTSLQGDECLPEGAGGSQPSAASPQGVDKHDDAKPAPGATAAPAGDAVSYDKDAVETQLRRAAKQVKGNCGSASDEDGNKKGPWGSTTATIVLGRNGHVSEVTVPAPYSGKPVGECVIRSFTKIQFPPFAGSSDVTISWDVDIAEPKHK